LGRAIASSVEWRAEVDGMHLSVYYTHSSTELSWCLFVHSFITETYIAPLQGSTPDPSTAKKEEF